MSFRICSSTEDNEAIKKYSKAPVYNANEIKNIPLQGQLGAEAAKQDQQDQQDLSKFFLIKEHGIIQKLIIKVM
jgi:hypothetical protein